MLLVTLSLLLAVSGGSLDTAVDAPWDLGYFQQSLSLSTLSYHRHLLHQEEEGREGRYEDKRKLCLTVLAIIIVTIITVIAGA